MENRLSNYLELDDTVVDAYDVVFDKWIKSQDEMIRIMIQRLMNGE